LSSSDDELIMRGLLYDEYKAYEDARKVYARLFGTTKAEIYLFKEAKASLLGKTHMHKSIKKLTAWGNKHPDTTEVHRLLIPLYLTINQIDSAKIQAEYILEQSNNPIDLELASNTFLYSGEFKRALEILSKVYEAMPKEMILLRMVEIMDKYTNERKRAIQLLEMHLRINDISHDVLVKLLLMYSKEQDIDGLLNTYKVLYNYGKDIKVLEKIIEIYMYQKDSFGAITYLEKNKVGDAILYELYKSQEDFEKALTLANRIYKEDKNAKWLAEIAILLFESAKDKDNSSMIKEVITSFEKAFALGLDDSMYLNYYGYTLIDKEVDVKKGIKAIKNALLQQPNNTYYLDSLAWGYFKNSLCSKAYQVMKRVVDEEGLKEAEIMEHWQAIKQCK